MKMYKISFYKDSQGNQPIKEYIVSLQSEASTNKNSRVKLRKIYKYMEILEKRGTRAGAKYTKHVENGIWELRPLRYRIFFFYWKDDTFILLHSFHKKTQKTPRMEIEQAKRNKRDFIERSNQHES